MTNTSSETETKGGTDFYCLLHTIAHYRTQHFAPISILHPHKTQRKERAGTKRGNEVLAHHAFLLFKIKHRLTEHTRSSQLSKGDLVDYRRNIQIDPIGRAAELNINLHLRHCIVHHIYEVVCIFFGEAKRWSDSKYIPIKATFSYQNPHFFHLFHHV